MKILIADDHSIVREGLKQYVKTLDEVKLIDETVNGNEAWTKIKDGSYDLVILALRFGLRPVLPLKREFKS